MNFRGAELACVKKKLLLCSRFYEMVSDDAANFTL